MAVRRPLILDGNYDLIEMTDAQIEDVQDRCRYRYGANPSVTLSVVSSGGSLGAAIALPVALTVGPPLGGDGGG